ncbi:MAG TPA: ROK family protein [Spirillospora sp.]|nr:ROK family protein [Spirillospora sp.]
MFDYFSTSAERNKAVELMIIGVDLGGTRIRAARLDDDLNILLRDETLTLADEGPDRVIGRIIDLIRAVWPPQAEVTGIGVSSPGPLDPVTGVVLAPPNLTGWHHVPLAQRLREVFNVPTYIGNDANVAVLAEVSRGAAQGCKHAIYVTLSTGIGGGVLIDGRLLLGHRGFAAHVGHMLMVIDGQELRLEQVAAGPAIARQARERIERGDSSVIRDLVQGDLTRIDSRIVGQAAQQGDPLALEIVQRAGRIIGLGLTSLLHLFNPEIIVIGGGVSKIGDLLLDPMRAAIRESVIYEGYIDQLRIEMAALGEDVSIIGAAALVHTQGGMIPLLA